MPTFEITFQVSYNYALADWGLRFFKKLKPPYDVQVVEEFCHAYIGVWTLLGDIPKIGHPQILKGIQRNDWMKLKDVFFQTYTTFPDFLKPDEPEVSNFPMINLFIES